MVAGPEPANAAAVFTANLVQAAPVRMSRRHLEQTTGRVRALIVTSGCANAATGPAGDDDQAAIAEALATTFGIEAVETVAASTGLIGTRLPVDRVREGLTLLATEAAYRCRRLGGVRDRDHDDRLAAQGGHDDHRPADRRPLLRQVRVSGVAKGVGMIHPRWRR
jgi:glutamate N-acetyltransferase/amino-acid N-acetyltransferase